MELKLTEDELDVLDFHVFRAIMRLEDAKLTDSRCYPELVKIHLKLMKLKQQTNKKEWL